MKQKTKVPLFGGRPVDWHVDCYEVEVTVNGEEGRGIVQLSYPEKTNKMATLLPNVPMYKQVFYSSAKPKLNKFIYHFAEETASSVAICGGKGASLALLTSISKMDNIVDRFYATDRLFRDHYVDPVRRQSITRIAGPKFIVPSGFVLSVSAMELMVSKNDHLNSSIEKLVKLCSAGEEFGEQCNVIRKAIEDLDLVDEIKVDILNALVEIKAGEEDIRLAVRSSSVCEDGEDVSAAGQNETFLGLRSEKDVLEAVKKCWASLYTFQSVHYRKQNIQPIRTGMAVVVQTMLDAECAGVLFSQNPILIDSKQILISANYGLGESVVSGEVDPDNYLVQRSYKDDRFTIIEKVCGKKGHKIQMSEDNSVEKVEVTGEEFCLSDDVVLKVAEIGVMLERLYGNGRDIEWGLKEVR